MTIKLIARYIITDENDNIIENIDDIYNPKLKVYDRKHKDVIAVLSNKDKEETFIMATAVIDALNNIPEEEGEDDLNP